MKTNELTLEAAVENLPRVIGFLEEHLEEAGASLRARMQIAVAAEEIFVNIAHYAYAPDTGEATVRVEITDDPAAARVTFLDRGVPFDPLEKPDPDITRPAEERDPGGLGIYMTKKTMDDVCYEYRDGQNILTLAKRL